MTSESGKNEEHSHSLQFWFFLISHHVDELTFSASLWDMMFVDVGLWTLTLSLQGIELMWLVYFTFQDVCMVASFQPSLILLNQIYWCSKCLWSLPFVGILHQKPFLRITHMGLTLKISIIYNNISYMLTWWDTESIFSEIILFYG